MASVQTELNYFTPPQDGSKPHNWINPPPEGQPIRNFADKYHPVKVLDLRQDTDKEFSIDTSGFELLDRPTSFTDFNNDEKIKTIYYAEIESILKERTGANRVFIFDHTIRKNHTGADTPDSRKPVSRVHIDQTPKAARDRVKLHMGEEAEELLKKRFMLINVWRPINGTVKDYPLAVCDFRSVDTKNDLYPTDLIYSPEKIGETYSVAYNPQHRWYYAKDIDNNEVIFLKCFDLDTGVLTPHTAFVDPNTKPEDKKRESIEVRALLFFK